MADPLNFTETRIDKLPIPQANQGKNGEKWYKDSNKTSTTKLQLRLLSSGSKTWYYVGKIDGKTHKIRLGAYPELNPVDARKAQEVKAGEIALGKNPQATQRQQTDLRRL